jgi:hypothetical protein
MRSHHHHQVEPLWYGPLIEYWCFTCEVPADDWVDYLFLVWEQCFTKEGSE